MTRRAADLIVQFLHQQGNARVYCVPGESYLTLLDALFDGDKVSTIVCRHESGAGFMALAEAKISGKPEVFAVSRGPGATNGAIALHVAEQDAVPLICLIGQVSRSEKGKGAFQEMDYQQFFGSVCKAVFEPDKAEQLPEVLAKAWEAAVAGTPGPVVISLPEDMLADETGANLIGVQARATGHVSAGDISTFAQALDKSERPLIIAGNSMRGERAGIALADFAERHQIPVAVGWKAQDVFDNSSPLYAGHIGFGAPPDQKAMLSKADLIIALGTRLGDVTTMNYSLPLAPKPDQPLVHVSDDEGQIGKVFETSLGVAANPVDFLKAVSSIKANESAGKTEWARQIKTFVDGFMAFKPVLPDDGVDFGAVVNALVGIAPDDAMIITDAGNFSSWVHRHWRLKQDHTMLGTIGGAMGFGVPGAVAASIADPERCVICMVGDGGILMTGQEIATAVACGARPKIILSDNSIFGTIRTHQEKRFPGRVSGTGLTNPDFTKWGESFGIHVVSIGQNDDIAAKLREAFDHDGAVLVHVHSSVEALSAFTSLSKLTG